MKKIILFITILSISFSINAQNSKISFGAKTGINLSKYTPDLYFENIKLADYQSKTGFYIGGFTNIKISDKFRIQPELLFSIQGTKILSEGIPMFNSDGSLTKIGSFEIKLSESTIYVPIILQYFISNKINLEGGIQLGYILNIKQEITKYSTNKNLTTANNISSYEKFDLGLNIGVGFNIFQNFRLNARYFLGVIERANSIKPSNFSLGIEYKL